MKEQDTLLRIINDPNVYYNYYNEKYHTLQQKIRELELKNIPPENLIPMRVKLAELTGKRAIVMGISHHMDQNIIQHYWTLINDGFNKATRSFEDIEQYEKNILYIQQKCHDV